MFLPRLADSDFHILTECSEEFHQAADGKIAGTIAHEQRDLGLLYAQDFGDLDLGQATVFEDRIDLQGELGFEELLFGIEETEIGEDVSGAFGYARCSAAGFFGFVFQFIGAFLDGGVRPKRERSSFCSCCPQLGAWLKRFTDLPERPNSSI